MPVPADILTRVPLSEVKFGYVGLERFDLVFVE